MYLFTYLIRHILGKEMVYLDTILPHSAPNGSRMGHDSGWCADDCIDNFIILSRIEEQCRGKVMTLANRLGLPSKTAGQ